ncbi:hypothetical protein SBOR_4448 [Sclerotinia borealis F-4128]|uniref:Peroxisomal biogenesis factor 11 n=1 Tax=Sclerotinia borealis (strain F-4128) TaxID=1432307 RepID=W9CGR8_SCLBF|nr:hypothetical protein SBOR_4448 [Sclerotinia borealis F-4128]
MGVLKQAVDFASDAAGLEKTLRFIQAWCQIFAFYPWVLGEVLGEWGWRLGMGLGLGLGIDENGIGIGNEEKVGEAVQGLLRTRREVAVGRRYLRFLRFIDHFSRAWTSFHSEKGVRMLIGVGKSGFMGLYLGLESLTIVRTIPTPIHTLLLASTGTRLRVEKRILDMMGIYHTPWSATCTLEGHKFWFYSLCLSILGGIFDLFELFNLDHSSTTPPSSNSKSAKNKTNPNPNTDHQEKKKQQPEIQKQKQQKTQTQIILKIIENAADLLIPGAVTGWIISDAGVVGVATVVSTVLSSGEIWRRVGDGDA